MILKKKKKTKKQLIHKKKCLKVAAKLSGATLVDCDSDKDSNFLTAQLITAAVGCRGGADSVKLR